MTHPNDTYLTIGQVTTRLGISRPTIYRWIARGDFPEGHLFSIGCRRWKLSDILTWEVSREADVLKKPTTSSAHAAQPRTAKAA